MSGERFSCVSDECTDAYRPQRGVCDIFFLNPIDEPKTQVIISVVQGQNLQPIDASTPLSGPKGSDGGFSRKKRRKKNRKRLMDTPDIDYEAISTLGSVSIEQVLSAAEVEFRLHRAVILLTGRGPVANKAKRCIFLALRLRTAMTYNEMAELLGVSHTTASERAKAAWSNVRTRAATKRLLSLCDSRFSNLRYFSPPEPPPAQVVEGGFSLVSPTIPS